MIDISKKSALFIIEGLLCFFLIIADAYGNNSNIFIEGIDSENITSQISVNIGLKGHKREDVDANQFSLTVDGIKINNVKLEKNINAIDDLMVLIISIDSSKSIKKLFLKDIKKISSSIVSSYKNKARIALYKFDNDITLLRGFDATGNEVISGIDSITNKGSQTLLYEAIYNGINRLSKSGDLNKSLIVFTDGKDDSSSITFDDVLLYSAEQHIPVNIVTEKSNPQNSLLSRIAIKTGGRIFYTRDDFVENRVVQYLECSRINKYKLTYKGNNFWGTTHILEVIYKNNEELDKVTSTIRYPGYWKRYLVFPSIIVILIVFLVFDFFIVMLIQTKKKTTKSNIEIGTNDPENQEFSFSKGDNVSNVPYDNNEHKTRFLRGWLIQKEGRESGKKFPLYWKEVDIGSDSQNSIVLNDTGISLKHARIRFAKESYFLLDLASENGTFLNGKKVLRPKKLNDWDEICIGRIALIFRGTNNRV